MRFRYLRDPLFLLSVATYFSNRLFLKSIWKDGFVHEHLNDWLDRNPNEAADIIRKRQSLLYVQALKFIQTKAPGAAPRARTRRTSRAAGGRSTRKRAARAGRRRGNK